MSIRVAVNGFGRIGKRVASILVDSDYAPDFELVAINDPAFAKTTHDNIANYFSMDSVFPALSTDVTGTENGLTVGGNTIPLLKEIDAKHFPWSDLDVDIVLECSGAYLTHAKASTHLSAGAKAVLMSAPAKDDTKTIVFGVNEDQITPEDIILSNASCTTNCLAPVVSALIDADIEIMQGGMLTVHAYTSDQTPHDSLKDPFRGRAAAHSIVPTSTGAAAAIGKVIPALAGKFSGMAQRVPVIDGSVAHLFLNTAKNVHAFEANLAIQMAVEDPASSISKVLGYTDKPLVSSDIIGNKLSSIFSLAHTSDNGNQLHVMSWYDNENGFAHRMLDTAALQYSRVLS